MKSFRESITGKIYKNTNFPKLQPWVDGSISEKFNKAIENDDSSEFQNLKTAAGLDTLGCLRTHFLQELIPFDMQDQSEITEA